MSLTIAPCPDCDQYCKVEDVDATSGLTIRSLELSCGHTLDTDAVLELIPRVAQPSAVLDIRSD